MITEGLQRVRGQWQEGIGGGPLDGWRGERCRMRHDRHLAGLGVDRLTGRQQVLYPQPLRQQNAICGAGGDLAFSMQEIRQMPLSEAGLAVEQGDAQCIPRQPAIELLSEPLMHLGKVHLWIVCTM